MLSYGSAELMIQLTQTHPHKAPILVSEWTSAKEKCTTAECKTGLVDCQSAQLIII